jgi:hypothetical protein
MSFAKIDIRVIRNCEGKVQQKEIADGNNLGNVLLVLLIILPIVDDFQEVLNMADHVIFFMQK